MWVRNALFDLSLLFSGTIFIWGVELVMTKNHSTVKSMSDVCRPIVFQPLLFCGMRYSIRSFFFFFFSFFLSAKNGGNIGTSTFTLSFGKHGGKILDHLYQVRCVRSLRS